MRKPERFLWITLLCLAPAALGAQTTPLADHPGYFPIDELGVFSGADTSVEINLTGAMLRMIGKVTVEEDPEFAAIVSDLEAITVRIAPTEKLDLVATREAMSRGAARLEELGWQAMVRIRDEDEQVYIYHRESDGEIAGMTVLVVDDDEAVAVNLIGAICHAGSRRFRKLQVGFTQGYAMVMVLGAAALLALFYILH